MSLTWLLVAFATNCTVCLAVSARRTKAGVAQLPTTPVLWLWELSAWVTMHMGNLTECMVRERRHWIRSTKALFEVGCRRTITRLPHWWWSWPSCSKSHVLKSQLCATMWGTCLPGRSSSRRTTVTFSGPAKISLLCFAGCRPLSLLRQTATTWLWFRLLWRRTSSSALCILGCFDAWAGTEKIFCFPDRLGGGPFIQGTCFIAAEHHCLQCMKLFTSLLDMSCTIIACHTRDMS